MDPQAAERGEGGHRLFVPWQLHTSARSSKAWPVDTQKQPLSSCTDYLAAQALGFRTSYWV